MLYRKHDVALRRDEVYKDAEMRLQASAALKWTTKSPFLDGLARTEIDSVLTAAVKRCFAAGTVVATQETPAAHLFLVAEGRARFFIITPEGKKILLLWLTEGEIFGVAALQSHACDYLVSTETVRDSTILLWDKKTIRRLVMQYPRLLENAIDLATEYLSFYVATHVALTCKTASQRMAAVILNLAHGIGRTVKDGIELNITNEELSQASNVTHFTASRVLRRWEANGAVIKERGRILLRAPEKL
ncbi:MAG TPA: Crp/Fnr family transcriptional regulator [Candidatus Angelobacter sp.]|nr:Crp/Fnr family transcriptional regulator [Candidatus Angelobacter sp.]